ncbi:MAG: BatD family protein [candidate division Zixibacteria bacterium]|nr:BatD family protein [candidate division Zixibacteria bacterium]
MRFGRISALILVLILSGMASGAQDIKFYSQVDRAQITLDEQVTLTVWLEGQMNSIPNPKVPALNQFILYEAGRAQNLSYVNGQVSSSVTFNYILMPKTAGTFSIPPFEILISGKTYRTNSLQITVSPAQSAPSPPPVAGRTETPADAKDLWIETTLDKDTVYVGEQVTLTLKFFQGVRLFQNPEFSPPTLTGFWSEDLPPIKKYYQRIGDRRYFVQEIKTALFPATSGDKTVGEAELRCRVEDLNSFLGRDPFSMLDQDLIQLFSQGKPRVLRSRPMQLTVLPLPAGQPAGFSGAVGKFNLKTVLNKTEIEAGQPLTLNVSITGVGNIKSVTAPDIPELEGFRSYNSNNSEEISKTNYKLQGKKVFEQILIPSQPGRFELHPLSFSYFDIAAREYKILKSPEYAITVMPGSPQSLAGAPARINQISREMKDINYLKTQLGESGPKVAFYRSVWFITLQSLPVLALGFLLGAKIRREKLQKDRGYARSKSALKNAKSVLHKAAHNLSTENNQQFYFLVFQALTAYLSDKFNLPAGVSSPENLLSQLRNRNLPEEKMKTLESILEECDLARFGGFSPDSSHKSKLLELAGTLLEFLEGHFKTSPKSSLPA